ncbi:MAG: 16S rRNA (guanine(527)-N(7))-methyltransferase RsmG [Deltaproteobacteria bacterium]|nr:16S rRNA (guanine(527)-N(7))-methyltransferase RsmG [Deltaproteobacteria bacterium]
MDEKTFKDTLKKGASELSVGLNEDALKDFHTYLNELKTWNKSVSLTALSSDEDMLAGLFLDSLTLVGVLKKYGCKRLLDIGSGAGFPGIPLKIAMPELEVLVMDSIEKKVFFMRHIIRTLSLDKKAALIDAKAVRAEDKKTISAYSGYFDGVTSRAFSGLKDFVQIALPYLKHNGVILAIKGPKALKEMEDLKDLADIKEISMFEAKIPFSDRTNHIVVVTKT